MVEDALRTREAQDLTSPPGEKHDVNVRAAVRHTVMATMLGMSLLVSPAGADSADLYLARATYIDGTSLDFLCDDPCIALWWHRYRLVATSLHTGETTEFVAAYRHTHQIATNRTWLVAVTPAANHPERQYIRADFVITDLEVAEEVFCPPGDLLPSSIEPDARSAGSRQCYTERRILELAP